MVGSIVARLLKFEPTLYVILFKINCNLSVLGVGVADLADWKLITKYNIDDDE